MTANDLIVRLQALLVNRPEGADLPVKFRTVNGILTSVDEADHMADTFGAWIELA